VTVRHPVFFNMIRHLLSRIGCLVVMAGSILLLLGIAAERSNQPGFNFLLIGVVLSISGFLIWNKTHDKQSHARRFSMFRHREDEKDDSRKRNGGWEDPYDR